MYERELAGDDRSATRPAGSANSLGFRSGIVIGIVVGLLVVLALLAVPDRGVTDAPAVIRERLEKVGLAFQLHHDSFGYFAQPRGGVHGTKLSWRVDLLPFLGHQQLYDHFHLHEPWDSPHNLQLLDLMPEVFRIGGEASHLTRIGVLAGPGSIFEPGKLPRHALLTDGAANTILAVAVSSEWAVPWTQPDELDIKQAPTDAGVAECLMADGQLLSLPAGTSPEIWQALALS